MLKECYYEYYSVTIDFVKVIAVTIEQKKNMRDQKPIATGGATSALSITRELFVSGSAPGGDRCVARSAEEIRQLTGRLCQMVGYLFGWSLSLPVILSSVRVQIKWDFLDFI